MRCFHRIGKAVAHASRGANITRHRLTFMMGAELVELVAFATVFSAFPCTQ
jgi:hypothetical protein